MKKEPVFAIPFGWNLRISSCSSPLTMVIISFILVGIVVASVQCQCGAQGGMSFDPVAGSFRPCCADHDECYLQCGKTQLVCDETFYQCMKNKCGSNSGCLAKAAGFYQAVASYGNTAYGSAQYASGCLSNCVYWIKLLPVFFFLTRTTNRYRMSIGCRYWEDIFLTQLPHIFSRIVRLSLQKSSYECSWDPTKLRQVSVPV